MASSEKTAPKFGRCPIKHSGNIAQSQADTATDIEKSIPGMLSVKFNRHLRYIDVCALNELPKKKYKKRHAIQNAAFTTVAFNGPLLRD